MRTVLETAFAEAGTELNEIGRQAFLGDRLHHLQLERCEARGIGNKGIVVQCKQFNMPGRVLAAAKLIAYLLRFRIRLRQQSVRRLDLPTPELPVKVEVFPFISRRSSSIPSPVSALVRTTG